MVFKHFSLELVKNHENDKGQGQNSYILHTYFAKKSAELEKGK